MNVIALEEAFSMEGLKMVPKPDDWPIPIDPQIMETWGTRLRDFEEWRLPDMDAHGVTVQVLSLTAPGIQAVPDAPTAIANAKIANDYLATIVTLKRPMWESDSEASNLILFQSLMLLFWPGAQ